MIPHALRFFLLGTALPLAVVGCKTNPNAGLSDVQRTVAARTGHSLESPQNEKANEQADSLVRNLLSNPLTADTAVQISLLNNRNLRATLKELGVSRANVIQAGLPRNPEFAASFRFPDRPPSAADNEFSLSQDFLDLLLLPLKKRVAVAQFEQTKLRVSHEVLQLVAEVKTACYTAQARQQLAERLQAIVEVNEAGADLATRQHKAGNISDLELANQGAAFQEAKLEWGKTQAQLRADRERLNRLLGLWGENTQWTVADSLPAIPEKEVPVEHLESLAVTQRLDLAVADRQVAVAVYALNLRSKTRYLPSFVNIGVDTERTPDRQSVTGPTLDIELPLFDHGQAAIVRLQAQYRLALNRRDALATDVRSEVREARDALITARDLAQFYAKIYLPQRIRIVNETLLQYDAMQKGTFELITAKERELSAEREYVEAWRDYWIARAELEKAVGGKLDAEPGQTDPSHTLAPSDGVRGKSNQDHQHEHNHK